MLLVFVLAYLVHLSTQIQYQQSPHPLSLKEIQEYIPSAHKYKLRAKGEIRIKDAKGKIVGKAYLTMPQSQDIRGFTGPADVLIVTNTQNIILGVKLRHSYDTPSHVIDVIENEDFQNQWNGLAITDLAVKNYKSVQEIHAVSGATDTSICQVKSLVKRAQGAMGITSSDNTTLNTHFDTHEILLLLLCAYATWLTFSKKKRKHYQRIIFQVLCLSYFIIYGHYLLSQASFFSWSRAGSFSQTGPGLIALLALALLLPSLGGKNIYCRDICPYGSMQKWIAKIHPSSHRHIPLIYAKSFQWIPFLIVCLMLACGVLVLPLDLSELEPFAAFSWSHLGVASTIIAIFGLLLSFFIPLAYCRFGCPTGILLRFLQGSACGRWLVRDSLATALLFICLIAYFYNSSITHFLAKLQGLIW
ncbi:MAG: FMN-binding protein [Planctomycetes bacterium]|nr:FMN-binding protein [Planctomycetota bacterium]